MTDSTYISKCVKCEKCGDKWHESDILYGKCPDCSDMYASDKAEHATHYATNGKA
jgi:hypothetical protein